jgi:hypothetical protein
MIETPAQPKISRMIDHSDGEGGGMALVLVSPYLDVCARRADDTVATGGHRPRSAN